VANNFHLHSNDKIKSGPRPPRRDAIPFDSGRRDVNDVRPINSDQGDSGVSYPGFWPRSLAGAGPIFLLGIAILCSLYPSLNNKRRSTTATSQPASPAPLVSKPSPIPPAVTAGPERSVMHARTPNAVPNLPGLPALHYRPMRYEATHKKAFGGCTGQLELTSVSLHFRCPSQADLDIPISAIAGAHKDGVVLASGEKYHFLIANQTKGQVEVIFNLWLNRVRQFHQPSRESSF
jgi:hypothetical protein